VHQYDELDACVADLRNRYQRIFTTHLAADAVSLHEMDFTQPVALVFGNEHSGCSAEMIAAADGNFLIPQVGIIQSLNISVACAVTIYEAFRQKMIAGHYEPTATLNFDQQALADAWGLPT
jgi:tRNA (guanosine-2'-O-)-methyltransferase